MSRTETAHRTAEQTGESIIEIRNLTVSYDRTTAVRSANLRLNKHSILGIIGPNGAGKSTLLKAMLGLTSPDSGSVRIYGQPVNRVRSCISYVPQKEMVDWDFPVTVYDLVMMGRYAHISSIGWPGRQDHRIVEQSIEKVGMSDYRHQQIGQLSGGQQQRVFLARSLAQQADMFLLDEPFVGVDASTEQTIISLIRELRNEGKMMVIVHHDLSKVREYFDQLVLINQRIVAAGPTPQVFTSDLLQRTYGGRLTLLDKSETLFDTQ